MAVLLALAMTASACGSSDDAASVIAETTTTSAAPETTTTTTASTTTQPPRTTIAAPDEIPPDPAEGWELVWSDEFDGDEVNLENWTYDIGGWGWGNGEVQYYTDRTDNARLENGMLTIEARQEKFEDSFYTSARLKTQGLQEFQYGRIEARIKVPSGKGMWPAFWMLGANFEENAADEANRWPNVGEIDIMEWVGREPDLILGTIHGPGYSGAGGKSTWFRQDFDVSEDWHTYAIEWDADGIRWFFDGELYATQTPDSLSQNREWVFDSEFFIILNLAIGGTLGGLVAPDLEFPVHLHVDHVRVYQPTNS